ncbi:MAG: hypothetical protein ABJF50_16865 [Paracoccaceae bacterium]
MNRKERRLFYSGVLAIVGAFISIYSRDYEIFWMEVVSAILIVAAAIWGYRIVWEK